jgi:hypothetical protein
VFNEKMLVDAVLNSIVNTLEINFDTWSKALWRYDTVISLHDEHALNTWHLFKHLKGH